MKFSDRHSRTSGIALSIRHEQWIYGIFAVLLLSGVMWLVFRYFITVHDGFGEEVHPLTNLWLRLHGAAAMVFLILLGTLLPVHVRRAWRLRRNRYAGVTLLVVVAALVVSGYGLYYASSEELRPWISVIHWNIGLLGLPSLVIHVVSGKREAASGR